MDNPTTKCPAEPAVPQQRLRLRYRKDEVLMYTGHLDLLRLVVRWLRRVEFPIATSGKFSPKPRITFGPVLPLGVLGESELLDLELQDGVHLTDEGIQQTLGRLGEVSAPRNFAVELRELSHEDPPVSTVAVSSVYCIDYASAELAALAYGGLRIGPLIFADKHGQARDEHESIIRHQLLGSSIEVLGKCSGDRQLNILRLAAKLEATGADTPLLCRRVALFNAAGTSL
jgi:radical SAM-linked protein